MGQKTERPSSISCPTFWGNRGLWLKKIDGNAIIEVTVNDKQKIRETISKTTIDKLVADFDAASGKKDRLRDFP